MFSTRKAAEKFTGKILLHNPAGVEKTLSFLRHRDGGLVISPSLLGAYLAQSSACSSYAYEVSGIGLIIAIAGVWHYEESSDVWLMTGGNTASYMVSFCRAMRRNLDCELKKSPSGKVRMMVVPGHRPGERLAKIMGLTPCCVDAGYRVWERLRDGSGSDTPIYCSGQRWHNHLLDTASE